MMFKREEYISYDRLTTSVLQRSHSQKLPKVYWISGVNRCHGGLLGLGRMLTLPFGE